MTTIAPVHREVLVAADLDTAFTQFTAHIGAWWPMATHSVYGATASVAFEGDRLVERLGQRSTVWGEVLAWDPPHRIRLSWHPGTDPADATELTIVFSAQEGQVLVALEHVGWERRADGAEAAKNYRSGWSVVLAGFAGQLGKR